MPEARASMGKNPSPKEIRRVLEFLLGPKMMSWYKALQTGSIVTLYELLVTRSLSTSSYLVTVHRATSRTKRGRGEYERFYIDIPIAVQRAMGIEEGSVVELRKYHKPR